MNPFLFITLYLSVPLIIFLAFLFCNIHYKWITKETFKETFKTNTHSDDLTEIGIQIIIAFITWPLLIFITLVFGTIFLIPKIIYHILPNNQTPEK